VADLWLSPRHGPVAREGWTVNRKRVRRLMSDMELQSKPGVRRRKRRIARTAFPLPEPGCKTWRSYDLNRLVSDITYIRLRREFVYLAVIMDVFTRCIRGWHLGRSLDQVLTLRALDRALAEGTPEITIRTRASSMQPRPMSRGSKRSTPRLVWPRLAPLAERLRGAAHAHHQGRGS